jgi:GT2 family glycosyltransferase
MADLPFVGIVTVTFNSADVLPPFLDSVSGQSFSNLLLIAVDNASRDESVPILRAWTAGRCKVIANPENRGVAAANNQGIREALDAGCTHVLLLNNDVEFGPALIEQLVAGLGEHKAQLSCPKILYFDEPGRIWMAGGAFEPLVGYRAVHTGENELDRGQYNTPKFVKYVPTCCVLVEREVFQQVGLMDERYFVYADDMDFMYRVMKAGLHLVYLPNATLLHKVGRLTGGETSPFSIRYGTRNRIFFLLKHFGLLRTLPWAAVAQVQWTMQYVMKKRDAAWYKLKQDAFKEAFKMPR